jgi:hypothetical protein
MRKQTPAHAQAWLVCVDPAQQDWLQSAHSHKSAQARRIKKLRSVVGDDGGTEPFWGRSVSFVLARIPFLVEGSADHFSEACPASGWNPRAKLLYSSRLQQANLYSQNLLNIATAAGRRQYRGPRKMSFSSSGARTSILTQSACKNFKAAAFFGRVGMRSPTFHS